MLVDGQGTRPMALKRSNLTLPLTNPDNSANPANPASSNQSSSPPRSVPAEQQKSSNINLSRGGAGRTGDLNSSSSRDEVHVNSSADMASSVSNSTGVPSGNNGILPLGGHDQEGSENDLD